MTPIQSRTPVPSYTLGYAGSVEVLDASAIHGDNPALSASSGDKDSMALAFMSVVGLFYCGVVAGGA